MRSNDVSADIKLYIRVSEASHHSNGLGLGVVELCERVEEFGSLNQAAHDMGMAYSKAWRIIKNAEERLEVPLFVRQGARGSLLTEEAKALISLYRKVEKETNECANKVLSEAMDDLVKKGIISS